MFRGSFNIDAVGYMASPSLRGERSDREPSDNRSGGHKSSFRRANVSEHLAVPKLRRFSPVSWFTIAPFDSAGLVPVCHNSTPLLLLVSGT